MAALELLPMSAPAGAAAAVTGLRARVERRGSEAAGYPLGPTHGYARKAWAPKGRPRAHLARADELVHGKEGSFAKGARACVRAPGRLVGCKRKG